MQEEYGLLVELAPLPGQTLISTTFSTLLLPLISLFNSTLSSLSSLIKRSLHKYTFLALSAYSSLSTQQSRWDDLLTRRGERKENELKDGLHALRGVCLRSFPEFLADLKVTALGKGGELGTGLADFTVSVSLHARDARLGAHAAHSALDDPLSRADTGGAGRRRVGPRDARGRQLAHGRRHADGGEQGPQVYRAADRAHPPGALHLCVPPFRLPSVPRRRAHRRAVDVVSTLINSLATLSRMQKRPAFGSVFLLNNVSYFRAQILDPRKPLRALLPRPTQDLVNSNFRTAKAGYFDSNFSPLMQALADDKEKAGASRAATKEKFTRFFDLFEEVKERHRMARVLEDEEGDRGLLADEVVKLVVPSLQRFTQKNREKEFSKSAFILPLSVDRVSRLPLGAHLQIPQSVRCVYWHWAFHTLMVELQTSRCPPRRSRLRSGVSIRRTNGASIFCYCCCRYYLSRIYPAR